MGLSPSTHRQPPRSRWSSWFRRHLFVASIAGCFVFDTASVFVGFAPQLNLIWVGNGILLAYLLLVSRKRWAAYLLAGFTAQMVGGTIVDPHWNPSLVPLNLAEVLICALLLRWRHNTTPRFTGLTDLVRFISFGVLAGPLITGCVFAFLSAHWWHMTLESAYLRWAAGDTLGIAIATPACIAIFHFKTNASLRQHAIYLGVFAGVTFAAFATDGLPLILLVYPLMVLVLFRLGLSWGAVSALFVAAVGSWYTVHGLGPFAATRSTSSIDPDILLQLFVAFGLFILYAGSVVLEGQKETARRLAETASLFAMVAENSRDAIMIDGLMGSRPYVSTAVEQMSGWTPREFAAMKRLDLVHPLDLPKAEEVVQNLVAGADGAMIDCRVRKKDGSYIWVEASLRTVRNTANGDPFGLLNIVRDITQRKIAEKQLQDAYNAVEALSITDPLTGLANRRRFDHCLSTEWRRGLREHAPISLLMIDADYFKVYNDTYGHPRGDNCLKQIAEAAMDIVSRPGDVVARIGGEEFAILLPATEDHGALTIGEEICAALRNRRLLHSGNPPGIVTVSMGCATMTPSFGQHGQALVELADAALYEAKRGGRNRVCAGLTLGQHVG